MSERDYLSIQLRAALDDAPGGEKAWVPIRRSLAVAIAEHLEATVSAGDQMEYARRVLRGLLETDFMPDVLRGAEPAAATEPRAVGNETEVWLQMDHEQRVEEIRHAVTTGEVPPYLPDKRVWRRWYPEAFAVNGEAQRA